MTLQREAAPAGKAEAAREDGGAFGKDEGEATPAEWEPLEVSVLLANGERQTLYLQPDKLFQLSFWVSTDDDAFFFELVALLDYERVADECGLDLDLHPHERYIWLQSIIDALIELGVIVDD